MNKLTEYELKQLSGVSDEKNATILWRDTAISIKRIITFKEYIELIQKTLHDCQSPESNIALELIDFAIRVNVIAYYTFVELPRDIEVLYYIAYNSGLYEIIYENSNKAQIESIKSTILLYLRPTDNIKEAD